MQVANLHVEAAAVKVSVSFRSVCETFEVLFPGSGRFWLNGVTSVLTRDEFVVAVRRTTQTAAVRGFSSGHVLVLGAKYWELI
jgi:hypothetical protein